MKFFLKNKIICLINILVVVFYVFSCGNNPYKDSNSDTDDNSDNDNDKELIFKRKIQQLDSELSKNDLALKYFNFLGNKIDRKKKYTEGEYKNLQESVHEAIQFSKLKLGDKQKYSNKIRKYKNSLDKEKQKFTIKIADELLKNLNDNSSNFKCINCKISKVATNSSLCEGCKIPKCIKCNINNALENSKYCQVCELEQAKTKIKQMFSNFYNSIDENYKKEFISEFLKLRKYKSFEDDNNYDGFLTKFTEKLVLEIKNKSDEQDQVYIDLNKDLNIIQKMILKKIKGKETKNNKQEDESQLEGENKNQEEGIEYPDFNYVELKRGIPKKFKKKKQSWEWFNYKEKRWISFSAEISKLIEEQYDEVGKEVLSFLSTDKINVPFKIYKANAVQICSVNGINTHPDNIHDINEAKNSYPQWVSEHMHRTLKLSRGEKWQYYKQGFYDLNENFAELINKNYKTPDSNGFICSYNINDKKYFIFKADGLIEYNSSPWNRAAIRRVQL